MSGSVDQAKHTAIKKSVCFAPALRIAIVLDFDNPIVDIGSWAKGAAVVMAGGPFAVGTHARDAVQTGHKPAASFDCGDIQLPIQLVKTRILGSRDDASLLPVNDRVWISVGFFR